MNCRRERKTMQTSEMMVSVYCLAYNHEKYIRSALDGFVSQKTDFLYEVFVHDDASTDGTAAIIREYAEKYPHIIKPILQTENQYSQGVKIFNTHILPRISGKYLAICEGDDFWCDPYKLQIQVDFLEANPEYAACVHNTRKLDLSNGKESLLFGNEAYDVTLAHTIRYGSAAYQTSSLLYRSQYAYNRPAFMFAVKSLGDYPMAIHLSLMGKMRYMPEAMSTYRANVPGSWTQRVGMRPEKLIAVTESTITMLKMADDFSGGAHHELFDEVVKKNEYKLLKLKREFRKAVRHPGYRTESAKERAKIFLLACAPWLLSIKRYGKDLLYRGK